MLYASLTLSTALHLEAGPEATLRLADYYTSDPNARGPEFLGWYPDFGSLREHAPSVQVLAHGELWKLSSIWPDAAYYVRQVEHPEQSIAPYKYRVLPTALVRAIKGVTSLSVEASFVLLNTLAAILTALLFEVLLRREFGLTPLGAALGGCLCVAAVSNTSTLLFPMLEPTSALCSVLVFLAVSRRNALGFVLAAIAGVATKEILVFASALWLLHRAPSEPWGRCLLVAALPLLAFAGIRVAYGGSALEVNYGFDVLHGQFPGYGKRLLGLRSLSGLLVQTFMAFSFTWLGLVNIPQHPFLRRSWPVIPLVVLAAFLLSGRITRVLGVLFPIVVPAFLLFFRPERPEHTERPERTAQEAT
ncbi:MAG: hypothetical protein ABW321_04855 [Polyangiales bacterium]